MTRKQNLTLRNLKIKCLIGWAISLVLLLIISFIYQWSYTTLLFCAAMIGLTFGYIHKLAKADYERNLEEETKDEVSAELVGSLISAYDKPEHVLNDLMDNEVPLTVGINVETYSDLDEEDLITSIPEAFLSYVDERITDHKETVMIWKTVGKQQVNIRIGDKLYTGGGIEEVMTDIVKIEFEYIDEEEENQ